MDERAPPADDQAPPDDQASTADAFAVVGSDLRLSILQTLWEADRPVGFSELHDMVGIRDSAQFNYHLKKLVPRFVEKDDDGYHLRWAGRYVVQAVLAGTFTSKELGPFPAGGTCVECGADLCARYEDDVLSIRCRECDRHHSMWPLPPGAIVDRSEAELLDAYNQWVRHVFDMAVRGICAQCGGRVETSLWTDFHPERPDCSVYEDESGELDTEDRDGPENDGEVRMTYRCQRCRMKAIAYPGMVLLADPDVQAFYREHGQTLQSVRYWTLPWAVDDQLTTIVSEDPPRVVVRIAIDDDAIAVTLDETLTVVDVERLGVEA